MRKRFNFTGHIFRITKSFSYNMAYEAFCKGYVNPEDLMGKEVLIPNEYGYKKEYTIVEVASELLSFIEVGASIK